jgi:hypothetical protein
MTANQASRSSPIADMSPHAVEQRLRDLAQLYRLGTVIEESRRAGKFRDLTDGPPSAGMVKTNEAGTVR